MQVNYCTRDRVGELYWSKEEKTIWNKIHTYSTARVERYKVATSLKFNWQLRILPRTIQYDSFACAFSSSDYSVQFECNK